MHGGGTEWRLRALVSEKGISLKEGVGEELGDMFHAERIIKLLIF